MAIDFQLYALLALILALCRVWRPLPLTLVSLLGVASLFVFNRDPGLDNLAIFYLGAYAKGAAAYWSAHSRHPALWLALMAGLVASSLFFDFRWRIAISLAVALLLGAARPRCLPLPFVRLFAYLGRTSYSLFLVHFPVYLLTSVLFSLSGQRSPALGMASFTLTWVASLILAHHFHQLVERPCGHLLGRLQGITLKGRS